MLDSVIESDKKYYPRTLLEECKYVQEKIKFENCINKELVTLMMQKNLTNNLLEVF